MRFILFVMIAGVAALPAVDERDDSDMSNVLVHAYNLTRKDADACVRKTAATPNDLMLITMAITQEREDLFDSKGIKRASCAFVCGAQIRGYMKGAKFQMPLLYELVKTSTIMESMKPKVCKHLNDCNTRMKQINDECVVMFKFMNCMHQRMSAMFNSR